MPLPGMGMAIIRAAAQNHDKTFVPAVRTTVKWSLLGGLASILVAGYYFYQHNNLLGASFLIIAAFIPFKDSLSLYQSFLEGKKLFNVSTLYRIADQIVTGAVLVLSILFSKNLFLILLAYFVPKVIVNLFFHLKTTKRVRPDSTEDPGAISYGKHLSFLSVLADISGQIDKILVWNRVGAASLATYSFAVAPVVQTRSFLTNVGPLATPKLAQRGLEELKQTLPRKLIIMFLALLAVVTVYILAAPLLFKILFSQYADSVLYSQLFALSLLFLPKNILANTITLHAPQKYIYLFNISASLVRIGLLISLVFAFGVLGAVFAYLMTELYTSILAIYLIFKKL